MSEKTPYVPTAEEMIDAHSRMSDEQKELSVVREAHVTADPRIAELPSDLKYLPEGTYGAAGAFQGEVSGTTDSGKVELRKFSIGGPITIKGTIDGEKMTDAEAEEQYDKLYPAVMAFDKMAKAEKETSMRVRLPLK